MNKKTVLIMLLTAIQVCCGRPTVFIVDPSMEEERLLEIFQRSDAYLLSQKRIGHEIVLMDGRTLDIKTRTIVPELKNPKGREKAIETHRSKTRLWFSSAAAEKYLTDAGNFDHTRIGLKLDSLFPEGGKVVIFSSPLFSGGKEYGFHFINPSTGELRIPSDRHLELDDTYTPFGTMGHVSRLEKFDIHLYSPVRDSEIGDTLETDALRRFWVMYFSMQSANVIPYTSDLSQVFDNLDRIDIESPQFDLRPGTAFEMITLSRSAGRTKKRVLDGETLTELDQFDHFIILNRTASMKRYWPKAMEKIKGMSNGSKYLTLLYSSYAYDPPAMEYVYGDGASSLIPTLNVVDLVPDKGKKDAIGLALNLVRQRIAANRIENAIISVFTDDPNTCDCPLPQDLNAFNEAERLIEAGHTLMIYNVSGKGNSQSLPRGTLIQSL